jgi:type I restriction enzyme R subunit
MTRNEHLTRVELIDPVLADKGWTDILVREEKTPGGVDVVDGKPRKRKGRSDYLLCLPISSGKAPLAVSLLEAKAEDKLPSLGIQQARDYMKKYNVPFVFSTNGHLFAEYGEDTGQIIQNCPMAEFPTPMALRERYEMMKGLRLDAEASKPLFMPYKGGEAARWYFQDAAIRATLEKLSAGKNRALLSLATGTGKTVLAAQLLWKIAQAGQLKRALFVCDRDELHTQGMGKMHAVFGDNAKIVTTDDPARNAKVLVATYQTLNVTVEDAEPRFWKDNYPPGFFSHIIIDECHRAAWGKWSVILTDNPDAVHIGLTGTPRQVVGGRKDDVSRKADEEITAHNIKYFGEPVYEYPMTTGQNDGYLAACEVIRRIVDLDKKEITRKDIEERSAVDPFTGKPVNPGEIEDKYTAPDYDNVLMLDDRVNAMCEDLFKLFLDSGGPHQKTIIFCARDSHANRVMITLNNLYEKWCRDNGRTPKEWFAFQCTGNPDLRPSADKLIPDFRGSRNSHFIAATVDLLGYGVDIPNCANVIFFRYIESPIMFYQMVGRGTRTGEPRGSKLLFRVYDYTNATRLFGQAFVSRAKPAKPSDEKEGGIGDPGGSQYGKTDVPRRKIIWIKEDKFTVQVDGAGHSILCEEDGKEVLVPLEIYKQRLADQLTETAPTVDDLRAIWIHPARRRNLMTSLPGGEGAVRLAREIEEEQECDLFDVLVNLGYGMPARSRPERVAAFGYKNKAWLREFPDRAAGVILAMARQFEHGGIEELETEKLFDVAEVVQSGGFDSLLRLPLPPQKLIEETKMRLLA